MGRRLSWCNGHEGHTRSWARLDRALINIHCANRFPSAFFEYLNRKTLDHCPMLIHLQKQEVAYGPHSFRFQNMWVTHADFRRCVEEAWKEPTIFVGLRRLAEKLKKTKLALRAWNKKVFGHVGQNIKELDERFEVLESHLQGGYDKEVECDYLVTKLELDIWEQREELRLSQLAKKKWLSEGDQNSKFFHVVVNQWRKCNVISHMRLENCTSLNSPEQVHQGALEYFQDYLSNPPFAEHVDLTSLFQKSVSEENNLALALAPTETEVLAALKSIPKQSSPGSDGFGSGFYLSCWDLIKEDVIDAVKDFFSVFVNGGKRSVQRLLNTLEVYEKWSGQLINKEKSAFFFSKSITIARRRNLMRSTGFMEGKFSFTYLGVPMVSGRLTSKHLEPLVEKVGRKIAGWKSKLLSQGDRLTLMKHVLAWIGYAKPYKEGGLGIRNFHEVQRSLHMKFAWRLVTIDNLWTKFFWAKYVKHDHIFLAETSRNASRFWKSIMKVVPDLAENVLVKVSEGSSSFWFDRWLASGPLCASRDSGHSQLKIKDVWIHGSWDENVLVDLVGLDKTKEIMNGVVAGKDLIRVKGTEHLGMAGFGITYFRRKSLCGHIESLSHVLCNGSIAAEVWKTAAITLGSQVTEGSFSVSFRLSLPGDSGGVVAKLAWRIQLNLRILKCLIWRDYGLFGN
ncbi:hypothetical protein Patl1_06269 [Pistacia atlantica]|uniref:Uncharacterized protein n=1 Tax=Pistacia atlantica TaxID=434234 RepID=A0ACC1BW72_9ROSI|nr:hypothetical protein Patl1_06269 [Pistacia atlantica]